MLGRLRSTRNVRSADPPSPPAGGDASCRGRCPGRGRAIRLGLVSMIRSAPRSRQLALDVALTAAVFGFSVVQMASQAWGDKAGEARGADMVGVAVCLLAALPLLARHRAPRAALVAVLGATVALVALDYAVLIAPAPAIVLAALAERDRRQDASLILIGCIVAFAAFVAVAWVRLEPEAGDCTITALLWAGGWIVSDHRRLSGQRAVQERERIAREQRLAVAEERTRIARELHDSAGHAINSILIQAGAARLVQDSQPERSREGIATIEALA